MALLEVREVSKRFGGVQALDGVSFDVDAGRVTGLIGPNGAGKTTLFHVIGGYLTPDGGQIRFAGQSIGARRPYQIARLGIARTFQDLKLFRRLSAVENVLLAFPDQRGDRLLRALGGRRPAGPADPLRGRATALLAEVGLEARADEPADRLSYGDQKLLTIARALATGARLILLDEPVAGLPLGLIDRVLAIVRALTAAGRTVLLVDHNVEAVMAVSDCVVALDHGRVVAVGPPDAVRRDPRVVATYLGTPVDAGAAARP